MEKPGPNYEMDELDRINPFDYDNFRPDAETSPPSASPEEEGGDDENLEKNHLMRDMGRTSDDKLSQNLQ